MMNDQGSTGQDSDGLHEELAFRVAYLVAGFIRGSLTESEHQELDDWVNSSLKNQRLFEKLTDDRNTEEMKDWKRKFQIERIKEDLKEKITFPKQKIRPRIYSILIYFSASVAIFGGIVIAWFLIEKNQS